GWHWLVRGAPPEKVEGDDVASHQQGKELVIDARIVRKAVHQHEHGIQARMLKNRNLAVGAPILAETRRLVIFRLHDDGVSQGLVSTGTSGGYEFRRS